MTLYWTVSLLIAILIDTLDLFPQDKTVVDISFVRVFYVTVPEDSLIFLVFLAIPKQATKVEGKEEDTSGWEESQVFLLIFLIGFSSSVVKDFKSY